jgi:hypothetical protein
MIRRNRRGDFAPFLDAAALGNELSGETAIRNLEGIARTRRQRGSQGCHKAAESAVERLWPERRHDSAIFCRWQDSLRCATQRCYFGYFFLVNVKVSAIDFP